MGSTEEHHEDPVAIPQWWPVDFAAYDDQLLPKKSIFGHKLPTGRRHVIDDARDDTRGFKEKLDGFSR